MRKEELENLYSPVVNELRLTLQAALMGEIVPSIRGITFKVEGQSVRIRTLFERRPTEDEEESMRCVETEVMASFPDHEVILECVELPVSRPIRDLELSGWVYARKEPVPLGITPERG